MLNSTASYGAPESTHYDFSHSLLDICAGAASAACISDALGIPQAETWMRIVVIGAPGAGETTLARAIAVVIECAARPMPQQ
jgi:stage III sporulation protein SpoIIIAA